MRKILLTFLTLFSYLLGTLGANQTYSINSPTTNSYTDATSGITVVGTKTTGKIDNATSQNIFSAKSAQPLFITSINANIKGISYDYDDSSSGSGSEAIMTIQTSTGGALATPTSGYSGTISINGGAASALGASLGGLAVGKDQTNHCAISVTFTSAVSTIAITTSSSNAAQIRNLVITYDDAISAPSLYATITPTGAANTYSVTAGKGSMTASSINATSMQIPSGTYFYQLNSSANTYTPAESLSAGDIIVFTMGNTSSKAIGVNIESSGALIVNKGIASQPYQIVYVVPSTKSTISFTRNSSDAYLKDIKIYHNSGGGDCTATAEAGADKVTTAETGVALAATAAGSGKTGTWSITSKPDGSTASTSSFSDVNSATATFTPDKVGDYTLTWTVECDDDDTETASDNMTVTANCIAISPTLSYASVGGTTLDVGDSSSGSPTVSGNTGSGSVSYAVTTASPAGCLTVNASTGVASAIAAGSATVTATIVASGNYCGNTATANFTIADDCTDPGLTITLN